MKKVYNIIDESPFYFELNGINFYFSSEFNLKRFKDSWKTYIKEENTKFLNRYNVGVDLTLPFIFSLYKKIEKRGYKVLTNSNFKLNKDLKFSTIIL